MKIEMIPTEKEWRLISGYPDYEISNYGQIKRIVSKKGRRAGSILKTYKAGSQREYDYVVLSHAGRTKKFAVHRLVAIAFIGLPPSPEYQVAHWDGKPVNNFAGNLRWATIAENHKDKIRHGTNTHPGLKGERHPLAKLTEVDVRQIRNEYHGQYGFLSLYARKYHVDVSTIQSVVKRETWGHI